jgi:putative ABC transport system substrate-binding protein
MRRREFMALVGATAVWPRVTHAQQPPGRIRRVGVLMSFPEGDKEGQLRAQTFRDRLEANGWKIGVNLLIDFRWGVGDIEWVRSAISDLMKSAPDLILANGDQAARAALPASRTIPIVFIGASDPVAEGLVRSLAHPGGNMTGFSTLEPSLGPKWLELLKEIAPRLARVAFLFNPANPGSVLLSRAAADGAKSFGLEVFAAPIAGAASIETAIGMVASQPNSGFVVPPDPTIAGHRKLMVELAARHRLPAVYALRSFVVEGGLISYGISIPELFRQAADYVDRILRGDKPEDLPVQVPTKFELLVNLKAAKQLGIEVAPTLLVRADEVIE